MSRPLKILLAAPRGFCAGVDRAIQIVEETLNKWGPPVYVRHEIVHNYHVVSRLEKMGAVFVDELDECPDDRPVVFSAHGVPKTVPAEAARREMTYLDATCPLVSKVHLEAQRHARAGRDIILIGHAGHPEVVGTMGQLPPGSMTLIETVADVETFEPKDPENLAFVTQTTLSVDDTAEIVKALQAKFPSITTPRREDICYATTNRQEAVKVMGQRADLFLVIGAETSSNSKRLVEVAAREGARQSELVASAENVNWDWFEGVETLGITAGASAPEDLVQGLIAACRARFDISVEEITTAEESVVFRLPKILKKDKAPV
ncbi:MAG: 4-hydroxy-3-methylbut-2-enyl diphosphate reductase [Pseudomonadota bacterium]